MSRETVLLFVLAAIAGAMGGIHVPINGALATRVQSTAVAVFTFYGVAFLLVATLLLLRGEARGLRALAGLPAWYYLVPGLISVVVVGASTFLMPRLGAVNVFVVTVSAQLLVRSVISHFGWLDSPVDPINLAKVCGGLLLVVGALLVVRG